jgi:hypothetical protein
MLFFVPNRTHRASQEVPDPLGKLETMPDGGSCYDPRESPISVVASDPITFVTTEQSYPGQLQSTWRHL